MFLTEPGYVYRALCWRPWPLRFGLLDFDGLTAHVTHENVNLFLAWEAGFEEATRTNDRKLSALKIRCCFYGHAQ